MRFLKIFSFLTFVCVILYLIAFSADGSVYNDVIRMHVIANSDSETDQQIKMEVRDMIVCKYSSELSRYNDRESALGAAQSMLTEIENDVNAYLSTRALYTCSATLEEKYFPTKEYGEYSLPRGNYTALCVKLGKSEGQNFWCVLFPPLCLGASSEDGEKLFTECGIDKDGYELMKKEKPVYKLKFRLLEMFN